MNPIIANHTIDAALSVAVLLYSPFIIGAVILIATALVLRRWPEERGPEQ